MRNGLIIHEDGTKRRYQRNRLHRFDGPAVVLPNGDRYWYQQGELHRTDGPAIEYANGDQAWYQNDKLHRTDGPAIEFVDGTKKWYFRGVEYNFIDWLEHANYTEVEKTLIRLTLTYA